MYRSSYAALALFTTLACPSLANAQASRRSIRDSVRLAIDQLVARPGTFGASYAAGDFEGDRTSFHILGRLTDQSPDSVLMPLVDCFTDSRPTHVRYKSRFLTRGGVCYLMLHNLVYRETDPEDNWPGNYFDFPTPTSLRAARTAWREAIRNHWYVVA
jgi:hypothetical protein